MRRCTGRGRSSECVWTRRGFLIASCRSAFTVACRILDTPCWQHTGSVCNKGYVQFTYCENGKKTWKRGHIAMWELVAGRKVLDGYTLDHRCLNTRCIRPDHMEELTREANTARGNRTRHGHAA